MQRMMVGLGAVYITLCLALTFVNVSANVQYSARRATSVDTVLEKVTNVTNTIFNSRLPQNANFSVLYSALVAAYNETETDDGFVWFINAQMEIAEQYFKACFGLRDQRPSVANIESHIQQFATILRTSPLDLSALRRQFGILICLHQQVAIPDHNCATVDCSGGLGNATTTGEFFCCLQSSDVRDLFGIESAATTADAVPCLAFVVDTTGSMAAEIAAVRAFVNAFVDPADPVCYILVDFNDVGGVEANSVFLRAVFDPSGTLPGGTLPQFTAAVNALTASGGGDCPEFGMAGLLLALNQISALPTLAAALSQMILVTDASSIDDFRSADVITQAQALGVRIHELLIRAGCGVNFGSFPAIATATGGIQVNSLADFNVITNFVQATLVAGGFAGNVGMFGLALPSHTVTVPKFAVILQVLIRTTQTQVNVARPDGTTQSLPVTGTLVFFQDDDPLSGDWMFSVASGTLEIAVNVRTLIDFFVSHVIDDPESTGILPVCEPTACSIGRVAVSSTRLSDVNLTQPIYLAIVNTTGGIIDEVQVLSCDGVLLSNEFLSFPTEEFRYRLRGTDCDGNSFTFISQIKVVIDLQLPTTLVLDDHSDLSFRARETQTISTRLQHGAVGNTLFFSTSASDGLILLDPTDEVTVPAGGIFTVMVTVTVSSSLAPGSAPFLYLTVEDPCSNITETFHWSILIFAGITGLGDDPHFSIVLPSGELLCYTVQGEHGFVFNLISNKKVQMNAMFVPDSRREEVTWLGSMGIVVQNSHYKLSNATYLRFETKGKKIYIGDKVALEAKKVEKLIFVKGKLTISETPPFEGFKYPSVVVDLQDVGLNFTIKFMGEHLDLFWHNTGIHTEDSHGLIGQFFRKAVEIDTVRKILILPGKEPVPVMRRPVWSFMEREVADDQLCWTAMNPGFQGEGLIDGNYFDYLMNDILSTDFKFNKQQ